MENMFNDDDLVAIRIRGLPFQARHEDVDAFFSQFNPAF